MSTAIRCEEYQTTGAAYKRLSQRLRSLPPPEKAAVVRVVTGIEPILTFDAQGPHYTVLSLSDYPHEHQVRPRRSGGWRCSCPSWSDCAHIHNVIQECAEHGEEEAITEWRRSIDERPD